MIRTFLPAAALAVGLAAAASAQPIAVEDAYARVSGPSAKSGAVFMVIENTGASDDRLVAVAAPVAERAELHTNLIDASGVARMVEVEDGFPIRAGQSHALARGGDHVMLLGLNAPLPDGASFPLTLTFEKAGTITVEVPVDSTRMGDAPAGQNMGHDMGQGMNHGMAHGAGASN